MYSKLMEDLGLIRDLEKISNIFAKEWTVTSIHVHSGIGLARMSVHHSTGAVSMSVILRRDLGDDKCALVGLARAPVRWFDGAGSIEPLGLAPDGVLMEETVVPEGKLLAIVRRLEGDIREHYQQ